MNLRQKTYLHASLLGLSALVLVGYTVFIGLRYFDSLERLESLRIASRLFADIEVFSAEMRAETNLRRAHDWEYLDQRAKVHVEYLKHIDALYRHGKNIERMLVNFEKLHRRYHEIEPGSQMDIESRVILVGQIRIEGSRMSAEVDYAFDVLRVGMKSMARHLLIVAWIWGIYLLASGLSTIWMMQRHVLTPLKILERDTEIIGQGRLTHRSMISSNDEIGHLSSVLNATAAKLDETLVSKQSLEVANLEIERSNQELQQFAYVASHDLQEPLRMVSSFSQLLVKRYRDKLDQDGQEFIDFISDGALRMQSLIRDLLAFSRIRTLGVELAPTDLNEILRLSLGNLQFAITDRDAKIKVETLPFVLGDRMQLIQLFQNLVGNAIKFCVERPVVEIGVSAEDTERVTVYVKDNGIGIDPKYQERIFQIFQRLNTREKFEGNGIGLSLCKRIMDRHDGSISLKSATGEGSTFFLDFRKVDPV